MPPQTSRASEIVEGLMELVVGLKRRARAGYEGQTLPYPQHAVLKQLDNAGPATTADLARAEHITPQAMGGLVAALEDAGYVIRRDDTADARRRVVSVTTAGRKILATNRATRHHWLAGLVEQQFDAEEQRTIAAALELLSKLFPPRAH